MEAPVLSPDEAEDLTKQAVIPVAAKDIDATFKSTFIGAVHADAVCRMKALICANSQISSPNLSVHESYPAPTNGSLPRIISLHLLHRFTSLASSLTLEHGEFLPRRQPSCFLLAVYPISIAIS